MALFLALAGCGPHVRAAGHTRIEDPSGEDPAASESRSKDASQIHLQEPIVAPQRAPFPEREILYADLPAGGRLVGKPGAIALEGLGRSGHWVSYCQGKDAPESQGGRSSLTSTTRGDLAEPVRLFLQIGEDEEEIGGLLAADPSGRYVVILDQEKAFLIDATRGTRAPLEPLVPDLRADLLPDHRSFAFTPEGLVVLSREKDDEGRQLGYFVPLFSSESVEQAITQARPIHFGKAPIWRLRAGWNDVVAITVPEGSTESAWPIEPAKDVVRRCGNRTRSFPAYERLTALHPDPTLGYSWLSLVSLPPPGRPLVATEAPGFVFGLGSAWVRREDTGRVVLVEGKVQKQITSERCGSRILRADPRTGLFLIACEEYAPKAPDKSRPDKKPKYRFDLYLVRPGFVRSLKADVARTGVDHAGASEASLFPIRPGQDAALVDFSQRKLIPIPGEVHILTANESQALLRRDRRLSLWSSRGEENVDVKVDDLAPLLIDGPAVALDGHLFLLEKNLRAWKLPGAPLAITSQGYALIPKKAALPQKPAEGPLLLIGPPDAQPAAP